MFRSSFLALSKLTICQMYGYLISDNQRQTSWLRMLCWPDHTGPHSGGLLGSRDVEQ